MSGKLERFTPNTIVKRTELRRELKKILAEGYSTSLLEKSDDMVAVAAPSAMPAVRSSPRCR